MVKRSAGRKTLASLAAELGVSRTTVSNAYNRPDQLAPETRERILAAARARGYSGPDPTARNLRRRFAGSVGVLLTDHLTYAFEDMATVDFLAGMSAAAESADNNLTLIPVGPDGGTEAAPARIGGAAVDGFVVYSVAADDPYLKAARGRGIPTVVCDQPTDTGLPFVGIDDRAAIAPAAQALVDAGHTKIGILAIRLMRERWDGPISCDELQRADMHVQRSRVLGALDVFGKAGIECGDIPIVTRHINDPDNAKAAAAELLAANPELTAVLCTTDSMALGVLTHAREQGLSVPDDLSVTGFDGIVPALLRGLTTVIQPNKQKGLAAGEVLQELIAASEDGPWDKGQPVKRLLGTEFEPGSTVGPPRRV